MLEELKIKVYEANMELPRRNLVTYTWGNVSGIDREKGLFVIKPSGVDYEDLKPEDLVVMDLAGRQVEGTLNPPGAVQRLPGNRRHRPHPQPPRRGLGPGWPEHPRLRHHPRRLLLRPHPLRPESDG